MGKEKNRGKKEYDNTEFAVQAVGGMPEDTFDMLHKYGTYNIQPTCDSDNEFPEIAQGLPKGKTVKELRPELEPDREI